MKEKLKEIWQKWRGYIIFFGAFLAWAVAYLLWSMYGRRQGGDSPPAPTLEAELEAARREVQTETDRQAAIRAAAEQRAKAAEAIRLEIERRNKEAEIRYKSVDDLAANGTDKELEEALRKQVEGK